MSLEEQSAPLGWDFQGMNKRMAEVFVSDYRLPPPSSEDEYTERVGRMMRAAGDEFKISMPYGVLLPKYIRHGLKVDERPKHHQRWIEIKYLNLGLYKKLDEALTLGYFDSEAPMSVTNFNGSVNAQNLQTGANSNITQTFNAETITLQELVKLIEEKGTPQEKTTLRTFLEGVSVAGSIEGLKFLASRLCGQ